MISHHLPLAMNFTLMGKFFPKEAVLWSEGKEIIDKLEICNGSYNAGLGRKSVAIESISKMSLVMKHRLKKLMTIEYLLCVSCFRCVGQFY